MAKKYAGYTFEELDEHFGLTEHGTFEKPLPPTGNAGRRGMCDRCSMSSVPKGQTWKWCGYYASWCKLVARNCLGPK